MAIPKCEWKVGLTIGRYQPLHIGHCQYMRCMIRECDEAIVCVGSINREDESRNPYTFEDRAEMIRNVFGNTLQVTGLADVGTPPELAVWVDYVLSELRRRGFPRPTDYYCGRTEDAIYYHHRFSTELCGSPYRLHVIHDAHKSTISASELRSLLARRDSAWKEYVPEMNHQLVEQRFLK